jgi:hypothetical protein
MEPIVEPLSYWRRKFIFICLVAAFLISLPIFMFYAAGYRYDFWSDEPTITATGGLYINADANLNKILIDEAEVNNLRSFRSAYYVQGLEPGLHRIHVQAPGLDTWVKELMVYPHIVTEVESFNLPLVPQVRPITKYVTPGGEKVFNAATSSIGLLSKSSSSLPYIVSLSKATSTYRTDSEYVLLLNLFAEQASTTAYLKAKEKAIAEKKFVFSTTTNSQKEAELASATTTIIRDNLRLYQAGEDVFVQALGEGKQIPHYFCTSETPKDFPEPEDNLIPIAIEKEDLIDEELTFEQAVGRERVCRTDIRIDRKWQEVKGFNFFPDNSNLVLMHLSEGVYVVEIDDRSWQNTQVLYPGQNLEVLVYGGAIFIKEGDYIFEAFTEIAAN